MFFLLAVVLVGCSFIYVYVATLSPGQYLIIAFIVYSFVLSLEPSYLDKKGKYCGNSFGQ